jgi:eukaryotic-like serine/threonine-protein kinase
VRAFAARTLTLRPGQSIGGYRIVAELGGGGMGVVYVGEHLLLGRRAAIKVLRPEHSQDTAMVPRFFAEARATTAIRHPGIVEVYDFGYTEGGLAYLVMELLEGRSLAEQLAVEPRLPVYAVVMIARRIALALAAAHECGVVHRDIKPDNIFLVRDREGGVVPHVKLLDFGIARLAASNARQTATGAVMGTPMYMSPEQCRGARDCDHRSDLYSLGCVLFEMLAGRPPFVADNLGELLAAHISCAPPDLRAIVPGIPGALVECVESMLAKKSSMRPAAATDIVVTMDRVVELLGLRNVRRRARCGTSSEDYRGAVGGLAPSCSPAPPRRSRPP